MARTEDVALEADDDSISLTSTVSSTKLERYEVECILAERKSKGVMEYLTAWKNYPENRHSWEPRECFFEDEVFSEWTRTQMRITQGLEKPFDVKAWKKRCKAIETDIHLRRERRRKKILWLSKRHELTPEEQDANIESSGSEPTPRSSNKRIKRRSVHQDSPPSSSTSDPSSSPSSEDSDRPLVSRRGSEIVITSSRWTQAEMIALEQGLRVLKGPRWTELLSLYGRNGTISQVLKDRTPGDLYDRAKSVRQEFVDSGREPPEYLKTFSQSAPSSKGSGTATSKILSRTQSRAASKKSSRSTSADSMMAELHERERIREAKTKSHHQSATDHTKKTTKVRESSTDDSLPRRQLKDGSRANEPSKISGISQAVRQSKSLAPSVKQASKSASTREDTTQTTWSGTARAPMARSSPSIPKPASRLGAVGSGPTRLRSSKPKPKQGQIEPKKPRETGDVTAAWNTEPKKRKSNNWATTNADPVDGQVRKRNYRLSVRQRIYKSRRDGCAPDPNCLIFIDPKTGKTPATVPAPSATAMAPKTPLQLHQEQLARRAAEEIQAQEDEKAMLVGTSERDPTPQIVDQDGEIRIGEQGRRSISNASASALRPTVGDMADGSAHTIDDHNPAPPPPPPPPATPYPGLPPNVPFEPRAETERRATMSLRDYTECPNPVNHLFNEAVINSQRPRDEPSSFTLRTYPSWEDKNELFKNLNADKVMGTIIFGKDNQEGNRVKLVGFGFETKRLLLTIKSEPRSMHFIFETVCLASEYQAYFPAEPSDYLGSGSVVSYHTSTADIENITETLANNLEGSLFFAPEYTMLIYPAGASAWAFLDQNLPNVHPGTALRFVVRRPLSPILADHGPPMAIARLNKGQPERYAEITTKIRKHPIQTEEKNINIVFRDMFEIDFGRLVAQNGPQQHPPTNIFFLCFIPQGCEDYEPDSAKRSALRRRTSEEHDLFVRFLQANGADEVYSMQSIGSHEIDINGAWDYFFKNVKSGTIIFHDACIRYDLVPRLAKHLLRGSVNVWKTSLSPMHPAEKHPHLVRLFPHGGVLLLTESLVLYRPRETLRTLMWFRRVHIPYKAPGTWKLAVRPRVREWLLDIMDACSDKEVFGCSIQIFADIYTEIYWLLQNPKTGENEDGLMCYEWDYETPTDEAPIVSSSSLGVLQARKEWKGEGADRAPDDDNIRQNDDLLVQWFAEWAIVNVHNFRKYNVILGYTSDHPFTKMAISAYEKAWGHIEVMTPEDAFTRHKVTAQSKLDEMEAERRQKLQEGLPAKRAAAKKARREERAAAKAALETRMQTFRDAGATEGEVMSAGRQFLRDLGGSEKEIEEGRVDMGRTFVDRWWEASVEDGGVNMEDVDTDKAGREAVDARTGTEPALPRTQNQPRDRQRARTSREASAAGSDGAQRMDMSS